MSGRHGVRVADRIQRVLAEAIGTELRDPRVGFVTLTDVKLSPDLRHAIAYVTVLGDESTDETLKALNHAVPFLRRTLARRAGLRHTPELRFVSDEAVSRGMRLEQLFTELRDERSDPVDES